MNLPQIVYVEREIIKIYDLCHGVYLSVSACATQM